MPQPQGPKQALFEHLAVVARALGHGARLELLDFLAQGERSVEDLARVAGLSIANTSKHLQQLKAAGLVQARRDGKHIRYTLGDERVLDAVAALRGDCAGPHRCGRGPGGELPQGPRCPGAGPRRRTCWSGCATAW